MTTIRTRPKSSIDMQRLFALLLLLLLFAVQLNAKSLAAPKKNAAKVVIDIGTVQVKKFNAAALDKYKADKDFNYSGKTDIGEPSLWERFWNWVWDIVGGLFEKIPYSGIIIRYLILGICVALVVYIIFKAMGINPIRMLRGEPGKAGISYSESLENIHEINFDNEIEGAILQHNYRLAVRLLYLKSLKQLSDAHLIYWQIDKTNSAYIYELTDPAQKRTFSILTRQFEFVWYGNFLIDKTAFSTINMLFQDFKKQLP